MSTPVPPIVEPIVDEAAQGTTTANADNSSIAKRPTTQLEESSQYFTKTKIETMFKKERDRATTAPKTLHLKPPYPEKVAEKDFSAEYKVPKFQKFDGHKGNRKEHVSRFLDSLGKYVKDPELCLKEFSKTLSDRAYSWYLSLKPGTIQDWEHVVAAFNTKFFFAEARYTLAELGRTRQYPGKDLDLYVKRFHDKTLDCVDPVDEEVLVNVCLHGMNNEYEVFLETLTFSSFSKLMEAARKTNESIRRIPKANQTFPRRDHLSKGSKPWQ